MNKIITATFTALTAMLLATSAMATDNTQEQGKCVNGKDCQTTCPCKADDKTCDPSKACKDDACKAACEAAAKNNGSTTH